jgi:hypothetical protein
MSLICKNKLRYFQEKLFRKLKIFELKQGHNSIKKLKKVLKCKLEFYIRYIFLEKKCEIFKKKTKSFVSCFQYFPKKIFQKNYKTNLFEIEILNSYKLYNFDFSRISPLEIFKKKIIRKKKAINFEKNNNLEFFYFLVRNIKNNFRNFQFYKSFFSEKFVTFLTGIKNLQKRCNFYTSLFKIDKEIYKNCQNKSYFINTSYIFMKKYLYFTKTISKFYKYHYFLKKQPKYVKTKIVSY